MGITVHPLSDVLGAEIKGVDLSNVLDDVTVRDIHDAWMEHLVLLIRGQSIDDQQLVEFSSRFGSLDGAPIGSERGGKVSTDEHNEITVISNVIEDGQPIGGLGNLESDWHTDMSSYDEPPAASVLYSLEIPPTGGDTSFCNMYRAYETLPREVQAKLQDLKAIHDATLTSTGGLRHGFEAVKDVTQTPGARHPILRTHPETERTALFLGRRTNAYVPGLSVEESEALLDMLWENSTKAENTWTHTWQVGDLIMWDNRCAMHRRDPFDNAARRIMHRTQITGDQPFYKPPEITPTAA
ncbi:MAG: taurine catabolism dioxygenase TauD [Alphaproteobacteria bacterium]|nr:taurine catabolism dioxygenase TauD [Alphaproteobacteria bacterium]